LFIGELSDRIVAGDSGEEMNRDKEEEEEGYYRVPGRREGRSIEKGGE
jgi:hypothetical protein